MGQMLAKEKECCMRQAAAQKGFSIEDFILVEPQIHIMADEYYEVEKVLKRRIKNGQIQYFLKWKGYPDSDNSWVPASNVTTDLIREFEKTTASSSSAGVRNKKSPNRPAVELSPPIRKSVKRRTTSLPLDEPPVVPKKQVTEAAEPVEFNLSGPPSDEELAHVREVYKNLTAEKVAGAVVLRKTLFHRIKWTCGADDLIPAKYTNVMFPHLVIAYYEAHITLHELGNSN